ncbi:unnamed protein product [Victoria cruziana]
MLGFADGRSTVGSDTKGRDDSPDSVITQAANFSLFSSATASMGRSSFESEGEDRESMASDRSKSLAGRDYKDISRAPDLEVISKSSTKDARNKQKARRECQKRRLRPEKKRTTSLDLNNAGDAYVVSSPRLVTMTTQQQQKISAARKSGTGSALASPGTPPLRSGLAQQRGCSSERVPLFHNGVRRHHVTASQIYPGKSLPSKWEDAEKWIFSPVSNDAPNRPVLPPRKPKSKSGPLALIGSGFSQAAPVPCTTRIAPSTAFQFAREDGHVGAGLGQAQSSNPEECMLRSASVHGWSDLVIQAPESPESLPACSNLKPDGTKDAATMISPAVSKRDMATQMSPEASSIVSSPRERDSSPSSPRPLTIMELQRIHRLSTLEIRDAELDDRVTTTRRSKRLVDRISLEVGDWKRKSVDAHTSAWEVAETAKCVSKFKREEAKIAAWENLQKAKAEAEIRKLEVKLEKLRSSSIEKIMNKLRAAQKKANDMRISVKAMQAQRAAKTAEKAATFRRTRHMGALSGCFTCHAAEC